MRAAYLSSKRIRLYLLAAPIYLYLCMFWFVEVSTIGGNIAAPYLIPAAFITGMLITHVDRKEFLRMLSRVRVEFGLLLLLSFLCLLSMSNTEAPFRAFRILFPCVLPFLIFLQLCALRSVSPEAVSRLPRNFSYIALLGSTLPLIASMAAPGLEGIVFTRSRLEGFLENPNQLSVVLAALLPAMIAEVAIAKTWPRRLAMGFFLLLLTYTLIRTGSKTALGVSLACCWLFYFIVSFRSFSPFKRSVLVGGMILSAFAIGMFGLQIADKIDPELGTKLRMVVSGGVGNYYSIESRQLLWDEAIRQGSEHWLVGAGAGQTILGNSHAHNLVLDYFRGVGFFGAAAVTLLCLVIIFRATFKAWQVLSRRAGDGEKRIFACYMAAVVYVLCNQLSDCFGPSTIAVLWFLYLPAVMMDRPMLLRKPARVKQVAPAKKLTLQATS